jgi:hypothetical protein
MRRATTTGRELALLSISGWGTLLVPLAFVLVGGACHGDSRAALDAAAAVADVKGAAAPGLSCSPGVDPADPLVADFSPATINGNKIRWGGASDLTLFTYDYHDNGSSSSRQIQSDAFNFSGQVNPGAGDSYAGGGMHFDSCVNTTSYTGVQFTLTGTSGGCTIAFDLQTYAQQAMNERGGCASYCYHFPNRVVTPQTTPTTISFSQLADTGIPATAAAMASEIMGMRWQLEPASGQADAGEVACSFDLTVDDVKFVK